MSEIHRLVEKISLSKIYMNITYITSITGIILLFIGSFFATDFTLFYIGMLLNAPIFFFLFLILIGCMESL
jgi:hypothetical protein